MNKAIKKLCFVLLVVSALAFAACGFIEAGGASSPIIRAEGPIVSGTFDLEPFSAITVGGNFDVVFRQSDEYRAVVTMSANIFEHLDIESEVSNNHFHFFSSTRGIGFEFNNTPRELVIYAPMLQEVRLSGSTTAIGWDSIVGDEFRITLSGSAYAHINADVQNLYARLSGSSDLVLHGRAETLEAHTSGSSEIHAFTLETANADLRLSGSSDINVFVTSSLNVNTSGSSGVVFMGDPVVTSSTSGRSTVQQR